MILSFCASRCSGIRAHASKRGIYPKWLINKNRLFLQVGVVVISSQFVSGYCHEESCGLGLVVHSNGVSIHPTLGYVFVDSGVTFVHSVGWPFVVPQLHLLQAYNGWRSIVRRRIRGPRGKVRSYDVVTQDHPSVLVFTWDTQARWHFVPCLVWLICEFSTEILF